MKVLDFMSTPVGRAIRIAAGLLMIVAGAVAGGPWWTLAAGGILPLATGAFGVCPISPLVGRSWRGNACRART